MSDPERSVVLTAAADIQSERSCFLWDPYVPLGTVTLFGGRGGEGKSSLALYIAALTQSGQLPGDLAGQPRAVLMLGHEDDWARVVKPRLAGADADLRTFYRVDIRTTIDDETLEVIPAFPLDIARVRDAIRSTNAGLVIIDPITATMDGDLHKVADVRRTLDPLVRLAQEMNCAVVGIMHFNKGAGNIGDKLSGSHAFRDATRSLLVFATDHESGRRVVTLEKSSYSAAAGTSFAFDLQTVEVLTDDGHTTAVPRVVYLGESDISASEILNRDNDDDDRSEAARWIAHQLEDAGGSAKSRDLRAAATKDGLSWDQVKRASRGLVEKSKSGYQGAWVWTLDPAKGAKSAKSAKEETPETPSRSLEREHTFSGARSLAPFAPFVEPALPLAFVATGTES